MINCDHHQYVSRHEPKTEQFLEKKVIELHDHLDVNELRIPHPKVIDSNDAYDPLATIHVASFFLKMTSSLCAVTFYLQCSALIFAAEILRLKH